MLLEDQQIVTKSIFHLCGALIGANRRGLCANGRLISVWTVFTQTWGQLAP